MKGIILLSALIPLISAHTRFTTLFVNSLSQGDGTCIRMDMNSLTTTDFISSVSSPDMACGVQGDLPVDRTCPLKPGDSISLLHRLYTDASQPGSIDPSHKGSTAVYMKRMATAGSSDPYASSASGDGWFKLAWNGYDENTHQWGTEKMIANDGKVEAVIPSSLPGGYYLIRSEVLALQNIIDDKVAPQFYAGCAQVYVDSAGSTDVDAQTVNIPGYVDSSAPALSYDIYSNTPPTVPYVEFGPQAVGSGSTGTGSISARAAVNVVVARSPRSRWQKNNINRRPTYNNVVDEWEADSDSSSNWVGGTEWEARVTASGSDSTYTTRTRTRTRTGTASSALDISTVSTSTSSLRGVSTGKKFITSRSSITTAMATATATATATVSSSSSSTSSRPTSSSSSSPSQSTTPSGSTFIGTCPPTTIHTVANQCLLELPSWTNDTPGSLPACWAASQTCWDTSKACWENISPAINADDMQGGCHAWEGKCNELVSWCQAGNLEGPPVWKGGNVNLVKRGVEFRG